MIYTQKSNMLNNNFLGANLRVDIVGAAKAIHQEIIHRGIAGDLTAAKPPLDFKLTVAKLSFPSPGRTVRIVSW